MLKQVRNSLLRRGLETAVQATADAAAVATGKSFNQVFNVTLPVTVYVRASHAAVTVRKQAGLKVELQATMQAAFGWEFLTEQDEAGVYLIARRKPLVGALSQARFTLVIPPEANLSLNLTPGSVYLAEIDGKLALPGDPAQ